MDVDPTPSLQCNKINVETYSPLHLDTSEDGGLTCLVLWNQFMILLYESDQLNCTPSVYHHDISIVKAQCTRNILLFIDSDNVIHFTVLRKQEGVKNTIASLIVFKRLFEGIVNFCTTDNEIIMLCAKGYDYFINVYDIKGSSMFKMNKKYKLNLDSFNVADSQIYIKKLNDFTPKFLKSILSIDTNTDLDSKILFVTKKDNLYSHRLNSNGRLTIVHTCPATISHLAFDDDLSSKLYIFLVTGCVLILSPDEKSDRVNLKTSYLNSSLHKVTFANRRILYTNTDRLWEGRIPEDEATIKHRLLKIAHVHDFSVSATKMVYCVTLNNLIYNFHLGSEEQYSSKKSLMDEEYVPIPKSLKATGKIFKNIQDEMDRNKRVCDTIVRENNLITTMALSKKPELSLDNLRAEVKVYRSMNDIDPESEIALVDDLHKYYMNNMIYLIEFDMSTEFREKFEIFLKNTTQTWYLNINLENDLKRNVICIKLFESLSLKIAVPVRDNIIPTNLCIKLVSLIPDAMTPNTYCWCFFPAQDITVDTKYHIRLKENEQNRLTLRKIENEDDKIIKIAKKHFRWIHDAGKVKTDAKTSFANIPYYIRVPESYEEYASEFISHFTEYLNPKCARTIAERFRPENIDTKICLEMMSDAVEIKSSTENKIRKIEISSKDGSQISWRIYVYFFECLSRFAETHSRRSIAHFDYMRLQVYLLTKYNTFPLYGRYFQNRVWIPKVGFFL